MPDDELLTLDAPTYEAEYREGYNAFFDGKPARILSRNNPKPEDVAFNRGWAAAKEEYAMRTSKEKP